MKSFIKVKQIDGAEVNVKPQHIEAIIELVPNSTQAFAYQDAACLICMVSGLVIPVTQSKAELENLLITSW